jgi:bifunctional UDP-N-acetylglucosamine pyrophosphorylase / glucosamine-1-phosphate N-acetyltransferase
MGIATIILAGGVGKRFKSTRPKVLHALAGQPLVHYPLEVAQKLRSQRTVLVVSPGIRREVAASLSGQLDKTTIAVQRKPLGTADATLVGLRSLKGFRGQVLILAGDVPLVQKATLSAFMGLVAKSGAPAGVLTVEQSDPTGYGRIVRGLDDRVSEIVEERDADAVTQTICEVNTGIFCCDAKWLASALRKIGTSNRQGEYYLTDIARVAHQAGKGLVAVLAEDAEEFLGVNSRVELAEAQHLLQMRILLQWMDAGVTIQDPHNTYIDAGVVIGADTVIEPMVSLRGTTRIGKDCRIGQGAILTDTKLGHGVIVKPYTISEDAVVGAEAQLGPFARLRPGTCLDRSVRIGNFVETKQSHLKTGVKANHLTYIGDATIGANTNVGCGTITCNYDGKNKHRTVIGKNVFIGSDTQFVAPVRVGSGATIGAGSVITDNVPAQSLAIARGRQVVKRKRAK